MERTTKCRSAHLSPKIFIPEFHSRDSQKHKLFLPRTEVQDGKTRRLPVQRGMKLCEGRVGQTRGGNGNHPNQRAGEKSSAFTQQLPSNQPPPAQREKSCSKWICSFYQALHDTQLRLLCLHPATVMCHFEVVSHTDIIKSESFQNLGESWNNELEKVTSSQCWLFPKVMETEKEKEFFFPPSYFLLHLLFSFFQFFFFCFARDRGLKNSSPVSLWEYQHRLLNFCESKLDKGGRFENAADNTIQRSFISATETLGIASFSCLPGKLNHLER